MTPIKFRHLFPLFFSACLCFADAADPAPKTDVDAPAVAPSQATPPVADVSAPVKAAHEQSNEEIAKALANPLAHMISLPFQFNWDHGAGPNHDGQDYLLKIQPVIPFQLSKDWAVISRSIFEVEYKKDMGYSGEFGLGDWTQTFFLSPMNRPGGLIIGAGPAFLIPTATENHLGQKKWGAGPSVVLVKETKDWTFGVLTNHIWDFAGDSTRDAVSQTFVQPFIVRHLPEAISVTLNAEYTYDWVHGQEYFPLNLTVSKVFRVGKMPVSVAFGGRYYIDKPDGGPDWGLRLMITLVLPSWQH